MHAVLLIKKNIVRYLTEYSLVGSGRQNYGASNFSYIKIRKHYEELVSNTYINYTVAVTRPSVSHEH